MDLMTREEYLALFDDYSSAFRAELRRDGYKASDQAEFDRWQDGAGAPDPAYVTAVTEDLTAELSDGRLAYRVKVMGRCDYDLYAAAWGYPVTVAAGENVFIIDTTERQVPVEVEGLEDFWVIDGRVVLVHYDDTGQFLGASHAPEQVTPRYLRARDALMAVAVPFRRWRDAHPDMQQRPRAA
jgi:hypothetical protein